MSGYALTFGGFLLLGGRIGRPARAAEDLHGRPRALRADLAARGLSHIVRDADRRAAPAGRRRRDPLARPSSRSCSSTFAEGAERNKALGILGAIAGSGAAIGVLLGGVLTEYVGWEWIFFVNVPIAIVALALVPRFVRESRAEGMTRHFDAAGAVTVTSSLMLLVFGAHAGEPRRLGAPPRRSASSRLGHADGDLPLDRDALALAARAALDLPPAHARRARTSSASAWAP